MKPKVIRQLSMPTKYNSRFPLPYSILFNSLTSRRVVRRVNLSKLHFNWFGLHFAVRLDFFYRASESLHNGINHMGEPVPVKEI